MRVGALFSDGHEAPDKSTMDESGIASLHNETSDSRAHAKEREKKSETSGWKLWVDRLSLRIYGGARFSRLQAARFHHFEVSNECALAQLHFLCLLLLKMFAKQDFVKKFFTASPHKN